MLGWSLIAGKRTPFRRRILRILAASYRALIQGNFHESEKTLRVNANSDEFFHGRSPRYGATEKGRFGS
jgi:hypothetical protein